MRPSILVVENHPDLRAEILATLQREHYECEGVGTGDAALLKIREHNYQYILVDVDAPTAAENVFDSLTAQTETRDKIVLLTNNEADDMPEAAAKCAQLRKPFDTKQLLARLRK